MQICPKLIIIIMISQYRCITYNAKKYMGSTKYQCMTEGQSESKSECLCITSVEVETQTRNFTKNRCGRK